MKMKISIIIVLAILIVSWRVEYSRADTSRLQLLKESSLTIEFLDDATVQVRYFLGDLPTPDVEVSFEPLSDTADTTLGRIDVTDDNGYAETVIVAGVEEVDFDIQITVPSDDNVDPLTVHVRVVSGARIPDISWPSEEFDSIQAAVDALDNGGTLTIAEGVHKVKEPIFIQGKRISIVGNGANCKDLVDGESGENKNNAINNSLGTWLIGPQVDEVAAPEDAYGLFNFIDSGGDISGLKVSGFDAGIVSRESDEGASMSLEVSDVCITDTGRGILWKASSQLSVSDTVITGVKWNGISLAPEAPEMNLKTHPFTDIKILDVENICIYERYSMAYIEDAYLVNCQGGGIGAFKSIITVIDTTLVNSTLAGIMLEDSFGILKENIILSTYAKDGVLGDAFVAWDDATVFMVDNYTHNSARAAVSNFGSWVSLEGNTFLCQSFDLQGENYPTPNDYYTFDLVGDTWCGCDPPSQLSSCGVVNAGLNPPPPIGGLE